jgi:hypothetical protein
LQLATHRRATLVQALSRARLGGSTFTCQNVVTS